MNPKFILMWSRIIWEFIMGVLIWVALTGLVMAADTDPTVGMAPKPSAPIWSRTGCHIGGHVGGIRSQSKDWTPRTPGGAHYGESLGSHDAESWLGGVQVGCDYQFTQGFVIGIQGDYAWANAESSHDSTRETGVAYHSTVKSLATVTGRLGYAFDRLLGYVRGGVAWQRDDLWATTTNLGTAYESSPTRPGWTIGVGAEYTFNRSLSSFVEYGYYNFTANNIELTPQVAGLSKAFVEITQITNVFRVGVNYRFGGSAAPITNK